MPGSIVIDTVMIITMTEQASAKGRFALGGWNRIRSSQYSISQIKLDVINTGRTHDLPIQMPDRITHPATLQPAPVMDRYSGLRLASNSYKISHARRAATKRVRPHTNRINTIHRSRVTPKGLFRGMNLVSISVIKG